MHAAQPAFADDGQHYIDEHEGYSILLPDGWTTEKRAGASIVLTSTSRDEDGFADNLTVVVQHNPAASAMTPGLLDLFVAKAKQSAKRQSRRRCRRGGLHVQIAGQQAAWIRYQREREQAPALAYQTWVDPVQGRSASCSRA